MIFYQPSQHWCDILTDHHTGVIFYQVNNPGVYKIKVGLQKHPQVWEIRYYKKVRDSEWGLFGCDILKGENSRWVDFTYFLLFLSWSCFHHSERFCRHFDQKGGWNMAHGARKLSWCSSEGNRKKCSFEGCTSYDQKGCFHMALRERLSDAASKDAPIKPKTKAFVERMEQRNIRLYLQPQGDMRNTNSFLSSGFIGTYLTVALLDHCAMRSYKLLTCPGCIVSPLYHVWYKLPLFGQTWYIPRSCISF